MATQGHICKSCTQQEAGDKLPPSPLAIYTADLSGQGEGALSLERCTLALILCVFGVSVSLSLLLGELTSPTITQDIVARVSDRNHT